MATTFPPPPEAAAPPAPPRPRSTATPNAPANAPRRVGRRLLLALGLIALSIGGALAYTWLNRPVAEVYRVGRGTAVAAVYGTVSLQPQFSLTFFAQSTGYIKLDPSLGKGSVAAQGLRVKNNQILGVIEDEPTTRALAQARTEFQAALAQQQGGTGTQKGLEGARDNLKRLKSVSGATIPAAQVAQAETTVLQLEAQVANEKSELARRVEAASLNVAALEKQLKRSEIRSTLDGVLTSAPPNDGALVFQNNPLFSVATTTTYVSGQVNEEDVGELRAGMKAEVRLYPYGGREFIATLAAVLPSADTSNQRYTVLLNLDQPPDNLLFGMTGEMNIIIGKHPDALLVPARGLRDREAKTGDRVYVVDNGAIAQRKVKVGYRNPETVEILEGLREGDLVVVSDLDLFAVGQRVRAVAENARAGR